MIKIAQNKGKDLEDIAVSKLSQGPYYASKKYDGHYVQIKYDAQLNEVSMWTSGSKAFYLHDFAEFIKQKALFSFYIECEFNYGCEGYFGDRGKSAVLTTYRTNYNKGILTPGDPDKDFFRVLDSVDSEFTFETRLQLLKSFENSPWFHPVEQHYCSTLEEAQELTAKWVKEGYEGGMYKSPKNKKTHKTTISRHNDIVKDKPRPTADLACIGWEYGKEGDKYEHLVGSLILQDSHGRVCKAGSGLSDNQRHIEPDWFIGRVIEIEYERIDQTYVQATIKHIRTDKQLSEID